MSDRSGKAGEAPAVRAGILERPGKPGAMEGRASAAVSVRAVPETLNAEARTVEAVLGTERAVEMFDWWTGETYREVLLSGGHRLAEGRDKIPLLDSHSRSKVGDQIGSITDIRAEGEKLVGTLRLASTNRGEEAWKLVREGHLTDVSVGYRVEERRMLDEGDSWTDEKTGRTYEGPAQVVTGWRLFEASLTPVGADEMATVRSARGMDSAGEAPAVRGASAGEREVRVGVLGADGVRWPDEENGAAGSGRVDDGKERRSGSGAAKETTVKDKTEQAPNEAPEQEKGREAAEVVSVEQLEKAREDAASRALEADRKRRAEIRQFAQVAERSGVNVAEVARKAEDEGWSADKAREEISKLVLDEKNVNAARGARVEGGYEPRDDIAERAADSILLRAGIGKPDKLHKGATELRGLTLVDLARHYLRTHGVPGVDTMSGRAVADLAVFRRSASGVHTTSDFASDVLANVLNKSLQASKPETPLIHERIARRITFNDYRPHRITNLSNFGDLEKVNEGGEIKYATVSGKYESVQAYDYAKAISLSNQTIMNDDLDAFAGVGAKMGRAAYRSLEKALMAVLIGSSGVGPTMTEDGTAMFTTAHGNLNASTGDPDVAALDTAFSKFMLVKTIDPDGGTAGEPMGLMPSIILVPPSQLGTTQQLINSTMDPAKSNNATNPYFNRLEILSSAYLEAAFSWEGTTYAGNADDWYLAAPEAGGLVFGTMGGLETPEVSVDDPFNTLGRDLRVVWAFGVGAEDWRGWQKNDHT